MKAKDTKPWYKSKAIIGSLVTAVCLILMVLGVGVETDEQGEVTDRTMQLIEAVGALTGIVLTIVGRVKAKKKLTA